MARQKASALGGTMKEVASNTKVRSCVRGWLLYETVSHLERNAHTIEATGCCALLLITRRST